MSQSSSTLRTHIPISIDYFIEMMNQDDRDVIQQHTLNAIKQFVSDDNDKFIQLMQLESKPENNTLIRVAAQNGRDEIVTFLINTAMQSKLGIQILRDQLSRVDAYDRTIIHWIAQINTDDVALCLASILNAGKKLVMMNYVNSRESVFGATPLIMAVKQGAIANIRVLLEHGADIYAKTKDDQTILDLIKYTDPKISIPTMKYFFKNTAYGYASFIKIHGDSFVKYYNAKNDKKDENADKLLSTLIAIDMDATLSHELAQLSALKLVTVGTLTAENIDEANLILANHSQINFAKALYAYKTHAKNERNTLINDVFDTAIEMSTVHNLSENNTSLLAEATFLLSFQLPEAHHSALLLFTLLMMDAPSLALDGFKRIDKTYLDFDNQLLLTRNILLTMVNIKLLDLTPVIHNEFVEYLLIKGNLFSHSHEKTEVRNKLKILLDDIKNTKDIIDIQTALNKISACNIKFKIFEDAEWDEMMDILTQQNNPKISL